MEACNYVKMIFLYKKLFVFNYEILGDDKNPKMQRSNLDNTHLNVSIQI